jgi:sucrose-6-phosphate hydrolase SacC (GH32 family)
LPDSSGGRAPSPAATGRQPVSPPAAAPASTAPATEVASATTPAGLPKESKPPPAILFGLDTVAAPDVRPHYVPPDRTVRDLRGFFRDGDDYHVFYDGTTREGRNSTDVWGHVVSRDLLFWKEAGVLTPPVPAAQTPQLGSVVVDAENVSGLGESDSPVWLATFTYAASGDAKKGVDVGLMSSSDRGKTWTAHERNPVLKDQPATSRWPRLFLHGESKQWGLLTYVSTTSTQASTEATRSKTATPPPATEPPKSTYRIFTSPDLSDWTQQHEFLYPAGAAPAELVELADSSDATKTRWMLLQGRGRYWIGEFDGTHFTTDRSGGSLQTGPGYYGFRALDGGDRKNVVLMSLVSSADSGTPTAAAFALPRRLSLQGGAVSPAREPTPAAWNGPAKQWQNHDLEPSLPLRVTEGGSVYRIQLQAQAEQAAALVVTIFGAPVKFDFAAKQYQVAGRTAAAYAATQVQIEGIVDVDLAELTIGGVGSVAFRTSSGPDAQTPLELKSVGGKVRVASLVVTPLKPVKPAAAAASPKP